MKKKVFAARAERRGAPDERFSAAEHAKLFELHRVLGCRWRLISRSFPGRTDNQVKNAFFARVRKALRRVARLSSDAGDGKALQRVKPRVLAAFMLEALELPPGLAAPEGGLSWLRQRRVSPVELIGSFAEAPGLRPGQAAQLQPVLDFVLAHLQSLNRSYAEVKVGEEAGEETRGAMGLALAEDFAAGLAAMREALRPGGRAQLAVSFNRLAQLAARLSMLLASERQGGELAGQLARLLGPAAPEPALPPGMVSLNARSSRESSRPATIVGPLFASDLDGGVEDADEGEGGAWPATPSFAGASLFRASKESGGGRKGPGSAA